MLLNFFSLVFIVAPTAMVNWWRIKFLNGAGRPHAHTWVEPLSFNYKLAGQHPRMRILVTVVITSNHLAREALQFFYLLCVVQVIQTIINLLCNWICTNLFNTLNTQCKLCEFGHIPYKVLVWEICPISAEQKI